MNIELTALHWVYLTLILLIIINMIMKRDTSLVSIAGVFAIGLIATGSLYASVMGIFNSFILAITELYGNHIDHLSNYRNEQGHAKDRRQ